MTTFLDSSVIVAALLDTEAYHVECAALVKQGGHGVLAHALLETFSALTGGRKFPRVPPDVASTALSGCAQNYLSCIYLDESQIRQAMEECTERGVRGGAIYDFMHLKAASLHGASKIYTLNVRHFLAFHRLGDPEVLLP